MGTMDRTTGILLFSLLAAAVAVGWLGYAFLLRSVGKDAFEERTWVDGPWFFWVSMLLMSFPVWLFLSAAWARCIG